MDFKLNGKVAVITGAASAKGIGNAVARSLASEGAMIAVSDIIEEGIQTLAADLQTEDIRTLAIRADQSKLSDVELAIETVIAEFGRLDILVNCAALTNNYGTVARMSPEKWEREIGINLNGAFFWIQQALSIMKDNKWGRIINISSVAGNFGTTGLPCYAVTKGAIHTLTKQVARENANSGITCNCLVLGIIATEIYERSGIDQATVDRLVEHIPMKRMGQPAEVASMATFLCSEQASYVTGAVMPVDGAFSISV